MADIVLINAHRLVEASQQRGGDSLASDVGDSDTGLAIVRVKIIVVVTPNPESWEAGAVDLQGVIFKPEVERSEAV